MTPRLSLLVDLYELTMAECYFRYMKDSCASFDLFVRQLPANRLFLVAAGLEDILTFIRTLSFGAEDIAYLASLKLFSGGFLEYLKGFRFSGDVWALPEGQVFFPNEPVLRVTAPIIQAQILEGFLLNTINLQTMIASKAARVVKAAHGRPVFDFSLRRTHGSDAAIKVARSAFIAGFSGTSNVLAGKLYGIPTSGTMAHSFVLSFKNELESFRAYAKTFPGRTILLVDTYDVKKGIENAVAVGLLLKRQGYKLAGIRLDSGDIVALSKLARKMLDKAGLAFVKIVASGNLDEFKIEQLLRNKACVDAFGVGTHMGTSFDAPALDVIYKLSEVSDFQGKYIPVMKLSRGKVTLPGRKQVLRRQSKNGKFIGDILALEDEDIPAKALLVKVVSGGRCVYQPPTLEQIRAHAQSELASLPQALGQISDRTNQRYSVELSPGLKQLTSSVRRQAIER